MVSALRRTAPPFFAIGGLGGSGTRAAAILARNCGCWLGGDLNDALDNLWYTLLFKRASALTDSETRLETLFRLFLGRMEGTLPEPGDMKHLRALAAQDRPDHTSVWLAARLESFTAPDAPRPQGSRSGWKEPNTHILIEHFFRYTPALKYVHVVRDPFYMASSKNQNQLKNWGRVFLDRDLVGGARDALAYWAAAHKRLEQIQADYPGRILFFSHDALMADPAQEAARLIDFLDLEPPADERQLFQGIVLRPAKRPDEAVLAAQADPDDLAYCKIFAERRIRRAMP